MMKSKNQIKQWKYINKINDLYVIICKKKGLKCLKADILFF